MLFWKLQTWTWQKKKNSEAAGIYYKEISRIRVTFLLWFLAWFRKPNGRLRVGSNDIHKHGTEDRQWKSECYLSSCLVSIFKLRWDLITYHLTCDMYTCSYKMIVDINGDHPGKSGIYIHPRCITSSKLNESIAFWQACSRVTTSHPF